MNEFSSFSHCTRSPPRCQTLMDVTSRADRRVGDWAGAIPNELSCPIGAPDPMKIMVACLHHCWRRDDLQRIRSPAPVLHSFSRDNFVRSMRSMRSMGSMEAPTDRLGPNFQRNPPARMAVNRACREGEESARTNPWGGAESAKAPRTNPQRRRSPAESAKRTQHGRSGDANPARTDKDGKLPRFGQFARDPGVIESCTHSHRSTDAAPG